MPELNWEVASGFVEPPSRSFFFPPETTVAPGEHKLVLMTNRIVFGDDDDDDDGEVLFAGFKLPGDGGVLTLEVVDCVFEAQSGAGLTVLVGAGVVWLGIRYARRASSKRLTGR